MRELRDRFQPVADVVQAMELRCVGNDGRPYATIRWNEQRRCLTIFKRRRIGKADKWYPTNDLLDDERRPRQANMSDVYATVEARKEHEQKPRDDYLIAEILRADLEWEEDIKAIMADNFLETGKETKEAERIKVDLGATGENRRHNSEDQRWCPNHPLELVATCPECNAHREMVFYTADAIKSGAANNGFYVVDKRSSFAKEIEGAG